MFVRSYIVVTTHTHTQNTCTHTSLHITHSHILQSEHIGFSMYDLILDEDYDEVKAAIAKAETSAILKRYLHSQIILQFSSP